MLSRLSAHTGDAQIVVVDADWGQEQFSPLPLSPLLRDVVLVLNSGGAGDLLRQRKNSNRKRFWALRFCRPLHRRPLFFVIIPATVLTGRLAPFGFQGEPLNLGRRVKSPE
jgi:hypothetical protein